MVGKKNPEARHQASWERITRGQQIDYTSRSKKCKWNIKKILEPSDITIVSKRKAKLIRDGHILTIGNIVSNLNFGFWTSLLDASYEEKLWRTQILKNTFPHMPRNVRKRKNISVVFSKIRRLRNRIFHYEPIWHWHDLLQHHEMIIQAIYWIEPQLFQLIDIKRFEQLYLEIAHRDTLISQENELEYI